MADDPMDKLLDLIEPLSLLESLLELRDMAVGLILKPLDI
jgi:hypothetical protein